MSIKDDLRYALESADDCRPRSQQVSIGPSQLGGCRRAVAYQIHQAPKVNQTERLASLIGTAMHGMIEHAIMEYWDSEDVEIEVEVPGVEDIGLGPGHIDLYRYSDFSVNDWKSTKKKNLRYFPKQQQRWQVHTYGFLMTSAGYRVDTVRLIAIPRDGTFADIVVHEEPYDENIAWAAMDWLAELWAGREGETLPEPEMSGLFCEQYCDFYGPDVGMCGGKQ